MKPDPTAYYALVAQVLPVLALLLLIEIRAFGDWAGWWNRGGSPDEARNISPLAAAVSLIYGGLFLFGEIAALTAVQDGKPSDFDQAVVPAALYLYMVMVVMFPMQMHVEALLERTPLRRLRLWIWGWSDRRLPAKSESDEQAPPPPPGGDSSEKGERPDHPQRRPPPAE